MLGILPNQPGPSWISSILNPTGDQPTKNLYGPNWIFTDPVPKLFKGQSELIWTIGFCKKLCWEFFQTNLGQVGFQASYTPLVTNQQKTYMGQIGFSQILCQNFSKGNFPLSGPLALVKNCVGNFPNQFGPSWIL